MAFLCRKPQWTWFRQKTKRRSVSGVMNWRGCCWNISTLKFRPALNSSLCSWPRQNRRWPSKTVLLFVYIFVWVFSLIFFAVVVYQWCFGDRFIRKKALQKAEVLSRKIRTSRKSTKFLGAIIPPYYSKPIAEPVEQSRGRRKSLTKRNGLNNAPKYLEKRRKSVDSSSAMENRMSVALEFKNGINNKMNSFMSGQARSTAKKYMKSVRSLIMKFIINFSIKESWFAEDSKSELIGQLNHFLEGRKCCTQ